MKKKQLLIIFLSSCIFSCGNLERNRLEQIHSHDLVKAGEIKISLDSLTGFYSPYISFDKKSEELTLLNPLINRLQSYNINTGTQVWNLDYDLIGPNGVGEQPSGFNIINKDSILIYDQWSGYMSLLDGTGSKINKFNFNPQGFNTGYASPQASGGKPITVIDQNIYMAGLLLPWEGVDINENQFITFNMSNERLDYKLKRPEHYNEANWGNRLMFFMSYTVDNENERFIFSFNNDHNIIISDFNFNNIRKVKTQSKYIDEITPYDNKFNYNWERDKVKEYHYQTPRFWKIIYDEYRKLTYRFVLHPYSKGDFNSGVRKMKVSILIIKDDVVVGEHDLDQNENDSRMLFISEEGLHIVNSRKFSENESELVFDTFVIKETGLE